MKVLVGICVAFMLMKGICLAQAPGRAIAGTVCDPSGDYAVIVECAPFQRTVRASIVEAGRTTMTDFALHVGNLRDAVTVHAASPQMHYESPTVSGVVTHDQIESVPLNGRGFLELAKLDPGVQSPSTTNRNRTLVPILGAPAMNVGGARFTVGGGSVRAVALGGAQISVSQEVVQEFQVASVNFSVAAGMTDAGAVNVITRAGANEPRATAFYFFRDHNLAAYPALRRDPSNPDPFFQRQQFGATAGGPVRRDRAFYFVSWERNDQEGVAATTLSGDFARLSRVTGSPVRGTLVSARVDLQINGAHSLMGAPVSPEAFNRRMGRTRVSLIAEAFNVFNAANLTGYTGDLRRADFGQPTSRVTQIFGSGGPRAVQVAARLAF